MRSRVAAPHWRKFYPHQCEQGRIQTALRRLPSVLAALPHHDALMVIWLAAAVHPGRFDPICRDSTYGRVTDGRLHDHLSIRLCGCQFGLRPGDLHRAQAVASDCVCCLIWPLIQQADGRSSIQLRKSGSTWSLQQPPLCKPAKHRSCSQILSSSPSSPSNATLTRGGLLPPRRLRLNRTLDPFGTWAASWLPWNRTSIELQNHTPKKSQSTSRAISS